MSNDTTQLVDVYFRLSFTYHEILLSLAHNHGIIPLSGNLPMSMYLVTVLCCFDFTSCLILATMGKKLGCFLLFLVSCVLDNRHVDSIVYSGHAWIHPLYYPIIEAELWIFICRCC